MEATSKYVLTLYSQTLPVGDSPVLKNRFYGYLTEHNGEPIGSWIFPGDCTYKDIRGILADDGYYDVEIIDDRDDDLDIMATI